MKTENLSNIKKGIIFFIFFIPNIFYSQNNVNLIIFINDEIITNSIGLKFYNESMQKEDEITYFPGKEISINKDVFKKNIRLKFYYNTFDYNKNIKTYNYDIPIDKNLFYDTNFLIIKIYNLDKKIYRKRYCRIKQDYIVDFQKSGVYIGNIKCK